MERTETKTDHTFHGDKERGVLGIHGVPGATEVISGVRLVRCTQN